MNQTEKVKFPKRPLCRMIKEGTVGDCPKCKSTTLKKYWYWPLSESKGCINPKCENYYKKEK